MYTEISIVGKYMPEEKIKNSEGELDIFIANSVYPEAAPIFTHGLRPLNEIKNDCFVVIDTNALLVPYNTGKESLEQIQKTYRKLVDDKRLLIPGQVAREFARNRANKITELFQQLNRKRNSTPGLQKGKYPLLESLEEYQDSVRLEGQIDRLLQQYRETLDKVLDYIRSWTWNDPVSVLYSQLFTQDVVFDISLNPEFLQSDLNRRQLHSVPPGYKDSAKDDKGIGDLLIWHTILEIGKTHNRSVIFVSGDEKADWWHRSESQPLYPRYELVDEFRRYSNGESFYIIAFSRFLDLYGASDKVVEEVRQKEILAKQDELQIREKTLSERQSKILDFLRDFTLENGYPPTIREIGEAVGITSTSVVNYNLDALQQAGLIYRDRNAIRGIRMVEALDEVSDTVDLVKVPLLGYITAGEPLLISLDNSNNKTDWIELTRDLVSDQEGIYALKVKGSFLSDAFINDGDIIILSRSETANSGDMLAVWLTDRKETMFRRFFHEGDRIRLQPENQTMASIYVKPDQVEIKGRVVAVIRELNQG